MKVIGKLESDEGEKFRVKRLKEGRRRSGHPRVPVFVEIWSREQQQWNEAAKFNGETPESARRGSSFCQRKDDGTIMQEAREEANWIAEGEVFPEQKWAERHSHR